MYWVGYLTRWEKTPYQWGNCKPTYLVYYFSQHCSAWILTVMTVERCVAIWLPLQSKTLCTVRNAKFLSATVAVAFLIFDCQWLIIITEKDAVCVYVDGVSQTYQDIYNTIDAALYSYIPFAIMMTANSAIALKMLLARKTNKVGDVGTAHATHGSTMSKNAKKTTFMLLSVSLVFCFSTMPVSTYYAVTTNVPPLAKALLINLGYLNHSINFVLYCLTGSKFRMEVFKCLPCKCKFKTSRSNHLTSTGTSRETNA